MQENRRGRGYCIVTNWGRANEKIQNLCIIGSGLKFTIHPSRGTGTELAFKSSAAEIKVYCSNRQPM
jgi:hypothetical protein